MNAMRPLKLQVCCLNLRHKMMYCDPRQNIPGLVDASSDTRIYFCTKSQDSLGPDGQPVHPEDCSDGRGCYCSGHTPPQPAAPKPDDSMA